MRISPTLEGRNRQLLDSVRVFASKDADVKELVFPKVLEESLRELGDRFNSQSPAGSSALLFGPPGVGKTAALIRLAAATDLPVWWVRNDRVFSSFLGGTASNVIQMLQVASREHAILVIDDVDSFARRRDDPRESPEARRGMAAFLAGMDNEESTTRLLCATNLPNSLDPAFVRRFTHLVRFEMPGRSEYTKLLRRVLRTTKISAGLLNACKHLSPAEITLVASANGSASTARLTELLLARARTKSWLNRGGPK